MDLTSRPTADRPIETTGSARRTTCAGRVCCRWRARVCIPPEIRPRWSIDRVPVHAPDAVVVLDQGIAVEVLGERRRCSVGHQLGDQRFVAPEPAGPEIQTARGPQPATDPVATLEHDHRPVGVGEDAGGIQSGRACPDHDDVDAGREGHRGGRCCHDRWADMLRPAGPAGSRPRRPSTHATSPRCVAVGQVPAGSTAQLEGLRRYPVCAVSSRRGADAVASRALGWNRVGPGARESGLHGAGRGGRCDGAARVLGRRGARERAGADAPGRIGIRSGRGVRPPSRRGRALGGRHRRRGRRRRPPLRRRLPRSGRSELHLGDPGERDEVDGHPSGT